KHALERQWLRTGKTYDDAGHWTTEGEPHRQACLALSRAILQTVGKICETPAQTAEGLTAKANALASMLGEQRGELALVAWSLARDIVAVCGGRFRPSSRYGESEHWWEREPIAARGFGKVYDDGPIRNGVQTAVWKNIRHPEGPAPWEQ
ncbi:MAG: hypothetical protein INR62_07565, partial [Rhodospirillales bacterium]|nr:hypothetical protein [Acetobacter sp.]